MRYLTEIVYTYHVWFGNMVNARHGVSALAWNGSWRVFLAKLLNADHISIIFSSQYFLD